jgi:hypothetical protein
VVALPATVKRLLRFLLPMLCVGLVAGAAPAGEEVPPAVLTIGDLNFHVEVQHFPDSYVGMTYFDQRLIRIDPSSMSQLRRKVYLHELMHVAWHQGSAPADKNRRYTEDEAIEELVPGLLQILKQNPDAVDYLRNQRGPEHESLATR